METPITYPLKWKDKLTFSLVKAPDWLSIDPEKGIILGRPSGGDVGFHIVSVKVESDKGKKDIQTFTVRVLP